MYCKNCGAELPDAATFCPSCGTATKSEATTTQNGATTVNVNLAQNAPGATAAAPKVSGSVTRLVLGIILIVFGVIALTQSCAASSVEAVGAAIGAETSGSGITGMFVAALMMASGIVSVATRRGKNGGIVAGAMLIFAGFTGIGISSDFGDMVLYGGMSLAFGVAILVVSIVWGGKGKKI